jgi:hypothetical protein
MIVAQEALNVVTVLCKLTNYSIFHVHYQIDENYLEGKASA